nr:odorant receptor 55 [Papilio glaucus]
MKQLGNNMFRSKVQQGFDFYVVFILSSYLTDYCITKMKDMDTEIVLYQKAINKVNTYLSITGLHLKNDEPEQIIKRISRRLFFCLNFLSLLYDVLGEISWLLKASLCGNLALIDLTFLGPCLIMCFLGCVKSYYFFKELPQAYKLVHELSLLCSDEIGLLSDKGKRTKYPRRHMRFLSRALTSLVTLYSMCIIAFSIAPLLISISQFYTTGVLKLLLPFFILYPFDAFNIYIWPFVYVHQVWSTVIAVFTVLGPDSLLYTSCVFINDHFHQLKHEIRIIFHQHGTILGMRDNGLKKKIAEVVEFHMKLLRYLQLIETIYSKSTLCNVLTSSLLICFTGFNVTATGNLIMVIPFIPFLLMVVGQIYLLCYYGDLIQKSNEELSEAVYTSAWYTVKAPVAKNLIIILIRQKPFKFTAYGFMDINMAAFTRIISTSWSYFALLQSLQRNN